MRAGTRTHIHHGVYPSLSMAMCLCVCVRVSSKCGLFFSFVRGGGRGGGGSQLTNNSQSSIRCPIAEMQKEEPERVRESVYGVMMSCVPRFAPDVLCDFI